MTLRERLKCQKVKVVLSKEKIKQEKKPTSKSTKYPKTPTKMPPKDQKNNFVLFYYQSPCKKEYLASLYNSSTFMIMYLCI